MDAKNLIRWLVIGGFAAYGIYGLVDGMMALARWHNAHWAVRWLLLAPLIVAVSGVFFAISYLTLTRRYRRLCALIAVAAALVTFGCIMSVPEWLGIPDWADPQRQGIWSVVGVPLRIVALVAGWYGARRVYRGVRPFLLSHVSQDLHEGPPR